MIFKEDFRPILQKFCRALLERSERIIVVLCATSIFLAMTTPRIHYLTNKIVVQTYLQYFHFGVVFCAAFLVLAYRPKYFFLAACTISLVILQSFSFLYWPSLNLGTPVQDYYLMDQVSSNYSFEQGMKYLLNFTLFLFTAWALWLLSVKKLFLTRSRLLLLFSGENTKQTHAVLLAVLAFTLLLNSGIAIYQWQVDFDFLTQGSGSATFTGRAPALLEDSGASTVYFAAHLTGVIFLIFNTSCHWPQKIIWSLIFIVGLFGGIASKGRIFFISFGLSLVILLFLLILRGIIRRNYAPLFASIVIFLTILIVWKLAENRYPYAVHTFKQVQSMPEILDHENPFSELMRRVDPIRGVHMKAMIKAFLEHPVFGTGYGSFYMNFFEHRQWAEKGIGRSYADPPSSLYFMFLSEFGIAGVLLVLVKLFFLGTAWSKVANSSSIISEKRNPTLLQSFSIGSLTSLAISFLIGLHLFFLSISAVFALSLIFSVDGGREEINKKKSSLILIYSIIGFSILLTISVAKQWLSAPPSPVFRWKERGKPQVPLNIPLPIQTLGKGTWLVSGAEVILTKPNQKIFVELPPDYYPLSVQFLIRNTKRKVLHERELLIEKFKLSKPGEVIEIDFDYSSCLPASISNYCSIQVKTTPVWIWHGKQVGYYFF